MKKVLFLLLLSIAFTSCSYEKVPAKTVGVKFHLLGGEKGIDYEVLTPGRYLIGMNEELFLFPTTNESKAFKKGSNKNEEFIFQSSRGSELRASVSVEYKVEEKNIPSIFETYTAGYEEITNKVLSNSLRDAFNQIGSTKLAEDVYGVGKTEFLNEVRVLAKANALEKGITIEDIYLIGKIGIQPKLQTAIDLKVEANQTAERKEDELRQEEADKQKRIKKSEGIADALLIEATAQAEANRIINASLSSNLILYREVEKWDGVKPKVLGGNSLVDLR